MRPLTERDLVTAYRLAAPPAVEIINSGKEVQPQVLLLGMSKSQPGLLKNFRLLDPVLVRAGHQSPGTKHGLFMLIKALLGVPSEELLGLDPVPMLSALGFEVHIAAHVVEAWIVRHKATALADVDLSIAPSEHPDRREVLNIGVHVREHTYGMVLPITTAADGKRLCEVLPWSPAEEEPHTFAGNFSIQQDWPPGWPQ